MNSSQKQFLAKYGTKDHLDELVDDGSVSSEVALIVAKNTNASDEQLTTLSASDNWLVRDTANSNLLNRKYDRYKTANDLNQNISEKT